VADTVAGASLQVGLGGALVADPVGARAALEASRRPISRLACALVAGGVKLVPVCSASCRR